MDENTLLIKLVIDENLRVITIPNELAVFGVVGDVEVNRVMFSMPKNYRGFDMSEFSARVNYVNANGDPNYYVADDVAGTEDEVTFTWLMSPDVTAYAGEVKFSIKFYKKQEGSIVKSFNTRPGTGRVLDGLDVEKQVTQEQQQTILEKIEAEAKGDIDAYIKAIKTEAEADIDTYTKAIKESLGDDIKTEIKDDMDSYITTTKENLTADIKDDVRKLKEELVEIDNLIGEVE